MVVSFSDKSACCRIYPSQIVDCKIVAHICFVLHAPGSFSVWPPQQTWFSPIFMPISCSQCWLGTARPDESNLYMIVARARGIYGLGTAPAQTNLFIMVFASFEVSVQPRCRPRNAFRQFSCSQRAGGAAPAPANPIHNWFSTVFEVQVWRWRRSGPDPSNS